MLIILVVVITGCYDRERINPFDPNSDTQAEPFNLRVESSGNRVTLAWSPVDSPDLTGYNIYRALQGNTLSKFASVADSVSRFTDTDVTNLTPYVYSVSANGNEDETFLATPDTIIPGPTRYWALSDGAQSMLHLSHDGFHLNESISIFIAPELIIAPGFRNLVLIYDRYEGALYWYQPGSEPSLIVSELDQVLDIFKTAGSSKIFMLRQDSTVVAVDIESQTTQTVRFSGKLTAGAVGSNGGLWIAEDNSLLWMSSGNYQKVRFYEVPEESEITSIADAGDDLMFLALREAGKVVILQNGNKEGEITEVDNPVQIEYSDLDNSLWIRSYNSSLGIYRIYRYQGEESTRMFTGAGSLYDIAVNPVDGTCLTADYDNERFYRIQPDGAVQSHGSFGGKVHELVVQRLPSD